ncbi:MAG: tRNA lysidine(34) synthetase TilS [Desulfobacterales bacterium]|nr:MAG: tRNA lysidine(34) synthetase TilS [Desulfobacterales bacterium]
MSKLLQTIEKTIAAYGMLKPKDSVVIGVSGGPDSVALLHILFLIAPRFSLKLGIAHLNHCLRNNDSDKDAQFVEDLAKKYDLPCYTNKKDVRKYQIENKLSLEEAARRVRYNFLDHVANTMQYNKIAVGHHSDDNAELILMNLFRGSGTQGLSGIPPVRDHKIIRPLIKLTRSEIIDFLNKNKLEYISDASNMDTKYFRNRVRHDLIPLLKTAFNPKIPETLNRLSSIIRSEEEWIEDLVHPFYEKCLRDVQGNYIVLSVSMLNRYHPDLQRRIIRMTIEKIKGDLRRIRFVNINSVIGLLKKRSAYGKVDLPDGVRIQRNQDALCVFQENNMLRDVSNKYSHSDKFTFEYQIEKFESVFLKEIGAYIKFTEMRMEKVFDYRNTGQHIGFFDKDILSFPLVIRNFRPGDAFKPLGVGGTQKLKKFFIDKKVPRSERLKCPILLSRGRIIWVVGYRIDESVKVMPSTKNVLKVELLLA